MKNHKLTKPRGTIINAVATLATLASLTLAPNASAQGRCGAFDFLEFDVGHQMVVDSVLGGGAVGTSSNFQFPTAGTVMSVASRGLAGPSFSVLLSEPVQGLNVVGRSIVATHERDGYIVVGEVNRQSESGPGTIRSVAMARLDTSGSVVWSTIERFNGVNASPSHIIQTGLTTYAITGLIDQDVLAMSIDGAGTVLASSRVGTNRYEEFGRRIFERADGTLAVIGSSNDLETRDISGYLVTFAANLVLMSAGRVAHTSEDVGGADIVENASGVLALVLNSLDAPELLVARPGTSAGFDATRIASPTGGLRAGGIHATPQGGIVIAGDHGDAGALILANDVGKPLASSRFAAEGTTTFESVEMTPANGAFMLGTVGDGQSSDLFFVRTSPSGDACCAQGFPTEDSEDSLDFIPIGAQSTVTSVSVGTLEGTIAGTPTQLCN